MCAVNYNSFKIMWKNDEVASVIFDQSHFKIKQNTNHARRIFKKGDSDITKRDVIAFLRRQVFDEHNANAEEILHSFNLSRFELWEVVRKTNAVSDRNFYWIKYEGEVLDYEKDIASRDIIKRRTAYKRVTKRYCAH